MAGAALLLVAGLYAATTNSIFGNHPKVSANAAPAMTAAAHTDELTIDSILLQVQDRLTPQQKARLNTLEGTLKQAAPEEKLHLNHQLARYWYDSLKMYEPYAWYTAEAAIEAGVETHVTLGNLDAVRDWGYAPEYVEGMWRMLQQDEPSDYVLATGVGHTVRQFCEAAFAHAGLNWEDHVNYDKQYERPTEVDALIGDAGKARELLGWEAQTKADKLAQIMVEADIEQMSRLLGK